MLLIWQLASSLAWISPQLFPSPASIFKNFYDTIVSGELAHHLGISVMRAMLGFFIGGKLTDSLVRILEAKLLKWQDSYRG